MRTKFSTFPNNAQTYESFIWNISQTTLTTDISCFVIALNFCFWDFQRGRLQCGRTCASFPSFGPASLLRRHIMGRYTNMASPSLMCSCYICFENTTTSSEKASKVKPIRFFHWQELLHHESCILRSKTFLNLHLFNRPPSLPAVIIFGSLDVIWAILRHPLYKTP